MQFTSTIMAWAIPYLWIATNYLKHQLPACWYKNYCGIPDFDCALADRKAMKIEYKKAICYKRARAKIQTYEQYEYDVLNVNRQNPWMGYKYWYLLTLRADKWPAYIQIVVNSIIY